MIAADEAKLNIMLPVHDELVTSSKQPEIDKIALVDCMENAYKLLVPVVAEVGVGNSWLDAKP